MNRGTFESLMIIRIREGTRIRVAADRDGGIDVVQFLDRTKMLDSLPSGLQVCTSFLVQMLGLIDITTGIIVVVKSCTTRRIQDRFRSVWNSSVGCSTFVNESRHFRITNDN